MKSKQIEGNMRKIFGIGLPRTGTASLTEALNIMGKPAKHYCIINGNDSKCNENEFEACVNNSFFLNLQNLPIQDSLFILTTRELKDWQHSISRFSDITIDLPSIDKYEEIVRNLFKEMDAEDQLLIVNIFEDPNAFKKISNFIGVPHSNDTFPHIKREGERIHGL